jgi:hypothetical protein
VEDEGGKLRCVKPLLPKVARHQPVRNTRLKGSSPVDPAAQGSPPKRVKSIVNSGTHVVLEGQIRCR